jgi:hypothetical protein
MEPTQASAVVRPSPRQHEAIRGLLHGLHGQPAHPLLILYGRHRTLEASWLCAFARAAGLEVRLAGTARHRHAIQRRLGQETAGQSAAFVLADMTLDLPPDAVQLAAPPDGSPLDLWQPQRVISDQARALAGTLPPELVINNSLALRVGAQGWVTDTGLRSGGQAQVFPAGAVEASVASATGTFVADGAIAVNRPLTMDARLATRPVTITVRDAAVTSVTCPDRELAHFLRRAVEVHRAGWLYAVRMGGNPLTRDFSPDQGPVNACHRGVTLRLGVDPGHPYSPASADLRIDLTASMNGGQP